MGKEEKPLEYQRRIRDTKGVAQRLDLDYLKRPALLALLRKRLTWGLIGVAVLACVPLVLGVGGAGAAVERTAFAGARVVRKALRSRATHRPSAACRTGPAGSATTGRRIRRTP